MKPTSDAARFRPLAPVGGTMWAASPASSSRPKRIGSATKLRSGAMLFSIDGPVCTASATGGGRRRRSSSQKASSLQRSTLSPSEHCT